MGGRPTEELGAAEGSVVLLFYQYEGLGARAAALAEEQRRLGAELRICGRVLVAPEGINGTVQGVEAALAAYRASVDAALGVGAGCPPIDWKTSRGGSEALFPDFAVKEVPELVSFGFHGRRGAGGVVDAPLDVRAEGGAHLAPEDFHRLLGETPREGLCLIDVRNSFEYDIGHFEGATDPRMTHTGQWPHFVDSRLEELRGKRVMMYCTGGIRCEKASAYLCRRLRETAGRAEGAAGEGGVVDPFAAVEAPEVYQLQGGIHRYLEAFPDGGRFRGANFVFDRRAQIRPEAPRADGDAIGDESAGIVGRCSECKAPWERHHGGRVCCVCRSLVLVCDACDAASPHGEYYCAEHSAFRGVYFHFVDRFGVEELEVHAAALGAMLAEELGPKRKNRRNTLRKKLAEVESRLQLLRADPPLAASLPPPRRCRACARPYAECPGACWGFWKDPAAVQ